ncbi:hypothetical protein L9F63_022251 [Diploptera punctata]|uniref:R3H-associated N-terminal domain-containing protein n=1 Tax=Diploptera punctata TaxID=6984 RepID=A0AAD7ZMG7_DIPPU|nr:hypothetical protein L9F63_022251 [Diploptera punctata]
MGVISKNDPKLGIFASSEESLNIPDYSDDERSNSNNEAMVLPVTRTSRRIRNRIPSVPMSFGSHKKRVGKKRSRRVENVNQLMTLMEDEELGELSIYDFVCHSNDVFQRLLEDNDSLEVWNNFVQSSEEIQTMITSVKGFHKYPKSLCSSNKSDMRLTGDEAFMNIKTGLRNVLKKNRVPLGMLEFLENQIVEFFSNMPHGTYISSACLSSYERLLLHAVSQYHRLISNSFDCEKEHVRLVKVFNPYKLYKSPEILLGKYLEDRRKMVVH